MKAPLDASPDGKEVLIVMTGSRDSRFLNRVALADGQKTILGPDGAVAGFWSPDGRRVALLHVAEREVTREVSDGDSGLGGGVYRITSREKVAQLTVMKPDGTELKVVVDDLKYSADGWISSSLLPSWSDPHTVLFFRTAKIYGDAGMATQLAAVKYNGTGLEDMQLTVDNAVDGVLKAAAAPPAAETTTPKKP
jgi:Tol biopolymer transport system component